MDDMACGNGFLTNVKIKFVFTVCKKSSPSNLFYFYLKIVNFNEGFIEFKWNINMCGVDTVDQQYIIDIPKESDYIVFS
jgi:hypothetical protein